MGAICILLKIPKFLVNFAASQHRNFKTFKINLITFEAALLKIKFPDLPFRQPCWRSGLESMTKLNFFIL